jgi:hypothetical protein
MAGGLLGLLSQKSFERSSGEETMQELEQLARAVEQQLGRKLDVASDQPAEVDWDALNKEFERDIKKLTCLPADKVDTQQALEALARAAEKKAGWPKGSLRGAVQAATDELSKSIEKRSR